MQTSRYLKLASSCLAVALTGSALGGTQAVGATPAPAAPQAVMLYVAPSVGGASDANDCTSPTTPCLTINGALAQSVTDADTINVTNNTLTGSGTEVVLVTKTVTIKGGWDSLFSNQFSQTTLDGQNSRRALTVGSTVTGTVVLENFYIRNGQGTGVQAGIYAQAGLIVRNTNFQGNANGLVVGGTGFTVTVFSSAFYSNTVGVLVNSGGTELRNVTVSGNTSKGISNVGGNLFVNNSTIFNNGNGGGLDSAATTRMQNTILAGNATDCAGTFTSNGFNVLGLLVVPNCAAALGTDKVESNPGLGALKNNGGFALSHLPFPASPALNAGSTSTPGSGGDACESVDQRGQSRPFGPQCDIGSWEYTVVINYRYLPIIKR